MSDVIVSKYGGSSVVGPDDVDLIRRIADDDPRRRVIVVSAPGKRDDSYTKVTDLLISLSKSNDPSLVDRIIDRYAIIFPGADLSTVRSVLSDRLAVSHEGREDAIKSFGEEANARLLASALGFDYVDPSALFEVTDDFAGSKILPVSASRIVDRLSDGRYVVPGFFGYTSDGRIATFSRGGSDLTGSYLAASLDALVYENFTDRLGVFAADPRIVDGPKKIDLLTFKEMRDLSYSGSTIFHPESIMPVEKRLVPVHVRSTRQYPEKGTYIVAERISDPKHPIVGVAYSEKFCSFDVCSPGLNDFKGVLRSITSVFDECGLSVEHMPTGIDDVSVILRQDQLDGKAGRLFSALRRLVPDGEVRFQQNLGCLVVAGKGLRDDLFVSPTILQTLYSAQVKPV
ncbi:TPA: hypothetical protein HA265_01045, partial [Candidatus Woesearchaeota archaeon]|nr:hypothetical protein [Candidatus Woesearchaeota archaeon]